jgi:hypothetical protein
VAHTELERLIAREGITIAIVPESPKPGTTAPALSLWAVTLRYQKRKYVTAFHTMVGAAPLVGDVIFNLCREVQSLDGTDGKFEAWAARCGYNLDSRTAYQLWQTVVTIAPKFRAFLGPKQREFLRAKHREMR